MGQKRKYCIRCSALFCKNCCRNSCKFKEFKNARRQSREQANRTQILNDVIQYLNLQEGETKTLLECNLRKSQYSYVVFRTTQIAKRFEKLFNQVPINGEIQENSRLIAQKCRYCQRTVRIGDTVVRILPFDTYNNLDYKFLASREENDQRRWLKQVKKRSITSDKIKSWSLGLPIIVLSLAVNYILRLILQSSDSHFFIFLVFTAAKILFNLILQFFVQLCLNQSQYVLKASREKDKAWISTCMILANSILVPITITYSSIDKNKEFWLVTYVAIDSLFYSLLMPFSKLLSNSLKRVIQEFRKMSLINHNVHIQEYFYEHLEAYAKLKFNRSQIFQMIILPIYTSVFFMPLFPLGPIFAFLGQIVLIHPFINIMVLHFWRKERDPSHEFALFFIRCLKVLPYLLLISVLFFLNLYIEKNNEDLPGQTISIVYSVWAVIACLILVNDFILPRWQSFNSYGLNKDKLKKNILSFFIDNPNLERKPNQRQLNIVLPPFIDRNFLLMLIPIHAETQFFEFVEFYCKMKYADSSFKKIQPLAQQLKQVLKEKAENHNDGGGDVDDGGDDDDGGEDEVEEVKEEASNHQEQPKIKVAPHPEKKQKNYDKADYSNVQPRYMQKLKQNGKNGKNRKNRKN